MKKYWIFAVLLMLVLSACSVPSAGSEESLLPEEVLIKELEKRGFEFASSYAVVEPYEGNCNGCVSSFGEFDENELLMYQFSVTDDPNNFMNAAISKDLQNFFVMSHVDGILYDIRDNPGYIHEGEYTRQQAVQVLEEYLAAETDIDTSRYFIYASAKNVDGAANYYITLKEWDETGENFTEERVEFYVSKDLKRIVQVEYFTGPTERLVYTARLEMDFGQLEPGTYTIDEAKQILLQWMQEMSIPEGTYPIISQEEINNWQESKVRVYEFRTLELNDIIAYVIYPDANYAEAYMVEEVVEEQRRFVVLREE